MNHITKFEIEQSLSRLKTLIESKVLWDTTGNNLFRQSVLIEVLIHLKDLLIKSEKHLNIRIDFIEDINPDNNLKIFDVTSLISNFRDACCHNDSFRRKHKSMVSSFNEASGKSILFSIDNIDIGCKYDDDIVFIMGINVLYLKRHIERAYFELESIFRPSL